MTTNFDHVTEVTVTKTLIKVIDEKTDTVKTMDINGKLNTTDSKKQAIEHGLTFISKEHIKQKFSVNTSELLKLKVSESE